MNADFWDTLIGYALAFALGVALTILVLAP